MVATRLSEVATMGKEWMYSSGTPPAATGSPPRSPPPRQSSVPPPPPPPSYSLPAGSRSSSATPENGPQPESSTSSSYWDYANLDTLADSTYRQLSTLFSSTVYGTTTSDNDRDILKKDSSLSQQSAASNNNSNIINNNNRPRKQLSFPSARKLLMLMDNPYNSVRGRSNHTDTNIDSMAAVRSLLTIVPGNDTEQQDNNKDVDNYYQPPISREEAALFVDDGTLGKTQSDVMLSDKQQISENNPAAAAAPGIDDMVDLESSWMAEYCSSNTAGYHHHSRSRRRSEPAPAETASQIAEGTVRALRDLCLDEAVELHHALRFWTERWERPVLSWLEAGPEVWTSPSGYNHRDVGQKVAQIQAVLARRCAAIGELQQHLLRAGWQRGVAQWGVLGHGGQWALVAGSDGIMSDEITSPLRKPQLVRSTSDVSESEASIPQYSKPKSKKEIVYNVSTTNPTTRTSATTRRKNTNLPRPSKVGILDPTPTKDTTGQATANIFVRRGDGGGLFVDDPTFLAEWSVEAIALVRFQITRAANGMMMIPYASNWKKRSTESTEEEEEGQLIIDEEPGIPTDPEQKESLLPEWATEITAHSTVESADPPSRDLVSHLNISDLPLLCEEVSALLTAIEEAMEIQRRRRLNVLRAPGWFRRNWYVVAMSAPPALYFWYKLFRQGYAKKLVKVATEKITEFYQERLQEPIVAIVKDFWSGREEFSDKQARVEAIESLKKMLKSWLDDTFPEMPEAERFARSENMDVTLLEKKKEEAMSSTAYNAINIVRMSFIEMQYMKKELLNALSAIDQMISANDINMNLAATTPVLLMIYLAQRFSRFCFYVLLKWGKSREETYASFRNILTDIERLLVMRDNPPQAPPPPSGFQRLNARGSAQTTEPDWNRPRVLGPDDLGMLMLLIHECRSILWRDRRRFTTEMIRGVSEDLAELAGERGAVSVQQQLQIITRMCRTYPFLKVTSIGYFQHSRLRTADAE